MSLSWRDRYVGVLTPDRVALVRRRRGWNGAWDMRLDAPCEARFDASQPGAAVRALAGLLAAPEVGAGNLTVLLSNHFVRYLLLPWRDEVGTPAELEAYAQICCDQVYGGDPAHRVLRISREGGRRPRLAAVLYAEFHSVLEEAVAASRLRLASIQPYLAAAFNRLGSELPRKDFLFLLAEPARTCLLSRRDGAWAGVRASGGGDDPQVLADLIARECQLLGLEPGAAPPVFIHAPRRARLDIGDNGGMPPAVLSLPVPAALAETTDHLLTMAMAA